MVDWERRVGRSDWIRAHGALQAVLIVLAALVVLVALGGCAVPTAPVVAGETRTEADLRALQAQIDALEARLARDEYALLAVDRHVTGAAAVASPDGPRARLIEAARARVAAQDAAGSHGTPPIQASSR